MRDLKITMIGMGYVGLPLLLEFANENFPTLGFDIDPKKVKQLNAGKSYIKHIPTKNIEKVVQNKKFEATADFSKLKEVDCILVCVPTPLGKHREPDISYIESTSEVIAQL